MSLGSKAKTECEIGGYVKSTCPKYLIHNESCNCCRRLQKWVPLEEWLTLNSQVKELTEKLVEALSDADKRIGIHKQEAQKLEADRDGAEALSHAIQEERNKLGVLLLKTLKEACNYENKMEAKIAEAKKILLEECYRCLAKSERNPLKEKCRDLCRTWRVREVLL
jgi:hypothetical protein